MQANHQANCGPIALLVAISLFFIPGCSAMQQDSRPGFNTQQSAEKARQQLQAANPVGSPVTAAQKNLEDLGFRCQALSSPGTRYKASMLCTLSPVMKEVQPSVTASPVPVTWMVGFHSADGVHLSKLVVSRVPQDIGE